MSIFSDIPVRSNADTGMVDASWWNTIRTALVSYFGAGGVDEFQVTLNNNQTSYSVIPGITLDHSTTRALALEYTITRDNGTVSRREMGVIHTFYKDREGTWAYDRESWGDDALGNSTVSDPLIISGGLLQYKTDDFAGSTSKIRIKVVISFAKET